MSIIQADRMEIEKKVEDCLFCDETVGGEEVKEEKWCWIMFFQTNDSFDNFKLLKELCVGYDWFSSNSVGRVAFRCENEKMFNAFVYEVRRHCLHMNIRLRRLMCVPCIEEDGSLLMDFEEDVKCDWSNVDAKYRASSYRNYI